jgi:hypothetical protein
VNGRALLPRDLDPDGVGAKGEDDGAKLSAHSVVERDAPTKGIEARDGATKQKLHALRREEGSREER